MERNSKAEDRALDAKCASERSMPARIAVTKLKAMSLQDKSLCLANYATLDLGNLVRCALAAGVSADTRCGEDNWPVLCIAAQCGSLQAVKALLVGGASHALTDKNGWTAAHDAASHGHTACLRLLLAAGAQLEAKTPEGATPLYLAAQEGRVEACELLLLSGASVAARAAGQETALQVASKKGHAVVIDRLLTAGAELEARDTGKRSPLGLATCDGQLEAVKALLARGADANAADSFGNTPLMEAITEKQTPCVQALLPVSDLSITNRQGRNAFHACIFTGRQECFQLLLPLMRDVDVRTVQGVDANGEPVDYNETPLHLACYFGQHNMVKALLRRGASRTSRDSEQRTPLHDACLAGHLSCVAQLLGAPGDYKLALEEVNASDVNGMTPLHFAAKNGFMQGCGALLAAGARRDAATPAGITPLMLAQFNHPENAELHELLLGRGAANAPGTVCDNCGASEAETRLRACSGCLVARYCCDSCLCAAWPVHKAECRRLQAAREDKTRARDVAAASNHTTTTG